MRMKCLIKKGLTLRVALLGAWVGIALLPACNPQGAGSDGGPPHIDPEADGLTLVSQPPESLGGGFLDISGPILTDPPFPIVKLDLSSVEIPNVTGGVFADFDGDGTVEIAVGNLECCPQTNKSTIYRYADGQLVHSPVDSERIAGVRGMIAAAVDLNGDGLTDLISSSPGFGITWGVEPGVFGATLRIPTTAGYEEDFSHMGALSLADIDADGWLDILAGDGSCQEGALTLNLLLRDGPESYTSRMDLIADQTPAGSPYAVFMTRLGPDVPTLFSMSAPCDFSNPNLGFFKSEQLDSDGYPVFTAFDPTPDDSPYKEAPDVSYGPITLASPMGASIGDIDGDGLLDLVTTLRQSYAFFRGNAAWPMTSMTEQAVIRPPKQVSESGAIGPPMIPWGTALIDLDRDGRADLVTAHGLSASFLFHDGYNGPQNVTVGWNAGDFYFSEITPLTGLDTPGSWRALTLGDLDADGDADLIVGGFGEMPRVYRNDIETENFGFSLRLRGTTSNHLGIGATVEIETPSGLPTRTQIVGHVASPHTVSDPLIFAGLGTDSLASIVRIRWPSGHVQEVLDLKAGALHLIEEPPILTLDPADRHVPADGESTAQIRVTPRTVAGELRLDAKVEIGLRFGEGTFSGPTVADGDGWTRSLVAPQTPGSAVIEVTVDGEPLPIRPRVWWTE